MKLFFLKSFWKYRRRALSRHGVHSPFVYHFIDRVLGDKSMHHLSERLQKYFPANKIQWIESAEPDKWWEAYQAADHTDGTIIVFRDIYRSKVHAAAWEKLAKQAEVQLSIDLFRYGLLFFRHQLQEKQHFVLKYRE